MHCHHRVEENRAATWRIVANYWYPIKMHYGGEKLGKIGEGIRIATKI